MEGNSVFERSVASLTVSRSDEEVVIQAKLGGDKLIFELLLSVFVMEMLSKLIKKLIECKLFQDFFIVFKPVFLVAISAAAHHLVDSVCIFFNFFLMEITMECMFEEAESQSIKDA